MSLYIIYLLRFNNDAKRLFQRGKKFTPAPHPNATQLNCDINEFNRKLRLMDYYANSVDSHDDLNVNYQRTDFIPSKGHNLELDNIINIIDNQSKPFFENESSRKRFNNMSR